MNCSIFVYSWCSGRGYFSRSSGASGANGAAGKGVEEGAGDGHGVKVQHSWGVQWFASDAECVARMGFGYYCLRHACLADCEQNGSSVGRWWGGIRNNFPP